MTISEVFIKNAAAVAGMMLVVWVISVLIKDASIVDIGWGLGFVLIAWVTFLTSDRTPRCWLIVLLTTIWGTRLSGYLARRNLGKGEDYRYVKMREKHGSRFPIVSLLTVFGLQGLIMLIVSLPLQTGMTVEAPTTLGLLACIGCAVWLIGFAFEAGGDWQLARFKADESNRGKVLDSGFWRYTRHPNYFGDFMIWWGVFLISFGTGAAWWSAIGPAVMSFFLIKVSGVAMLEKTLKKKPGYADYIAKTNAFFPWFPAR
jgi:steroid 5-alpha reductase family enzyme